jgi:DnaJ-class molecular chaperone
MKDPYEILGVAKTAAPEAIRKAYLRLAKKLHPDLNPGSTDSEDRFKEVSGAYDLLSDPAKRLRFDSGEIDASGSERQRERFYKDYAAQAAPDDRYENRSGYADFAETDDLFAELLRRQARESRRAKGANAHYQLSVEFLDAINGATKRITLPGGGSLDVTIPPGIQEGQILRLRGKGAPSGGEGEAGDALVEISINLHPFFIRKGDDIHIDLPITLTEAVLGAQIKAPTPAGLVLLTVPKGSNTGTVLRLKGKGVPKRGGHGDEFITFKVMLPTEPSPDLETFLSNWTPAKTYNPRREMLS